MVRGHRALGTPCKPHVSPRPKLLEALPCQLKGEKVSAKQLPSYKKIDEKCSAILVGVGVCELQRAARLQLCGMDTCF